MFGKRSGPDIETRAIKPAAGAQEPASSAATAVTRSAPPPPTVSSPPLSPAKAGSPRRRKPALGQLLPGQGDHLRRPDRGDRPRPARQARRRVRARGNPRHRQRDHRDQEHRDVDRRAGGTARRHLQRRARIRAAGAAVVARRHLRHHGQRRRHGVHRSRGPHPAHRNPLPRQSAIAEHLPAHRQPGRPARRRILADLRRAPRRRLPRQRHRSAAGARRPRAHDPQIQEGQADAGSAGQVRRDLAGRRRDPADHRALPRQRADFRRHRLRQDDAAELPDQLHRRRRTRHHLRRRRRTAAAAAACGAAGNPSAQHRGRRPDHHARTGPELPAYAPRTHHRRRSPRTGGVRPAAGHEHRSRRIDGNAARQQSARSPVALRIDDHDGRVLAAVADHSRDDLRLDRRHHPGRPPARRFPAHHPHHRGDGHGRRHHHYPGPVPLRPGRRGRQRHTSSAGIARPASAGRGSGIAPGITAKRSGWPQRSTPPKSSQNPRGACHEDTSARTRLPRRHRDRRRCLGLYLSPAVGGEESREPPGVGGQVGADRRACRRQEPALAPRAGRVVAEGARGAPAEGKQGDPEHPSHAGGARLDAPRNS